VFIFGNGINIVVTFYIVQLRVSHSALCSVLMMFVTVDLHCGGVLFLLLLEHSSMAVTLFVKICNMTWKSKSKYVILTAVVPHLPSDQVQVNCFIF